MAGADSEALDASVGSGDLASQQPLLDQLPRPAASAFSSSSAAATCATWAVTAMPSAGLVLAVLLMVVAAVRLLQLPSTLLLLPHEPRAALHSDLSITCPPLLLPPRPAEASQAAVSAALRNSNSSGNSNSWPPVWPPAWASSDASALSHLNATLSVVQADVLRIFNWSRLLPRVVVALVSGPQRLCRGDELRLPSAPALRGVLTSSADAYGGYLVLQFGSDRDPTVPLLAQHSGAMVAATEVSVASLSRLWSFVLRLPQCDVQQWTPEQGRHCLRNRALLLIGDSLTRYQFYSLVWMAAVGAWPYGFSHPSRSTFLSGIYGKANAALWIKELLGGDWRSTRWPLQLYSNSRLNLTIAYAFVKGPSYNDSLLYHLDRVRQTMAELGLPYATPNSTARVFDVMVDNVGLWDVDPALNKSDALVDADDPAALNRTVEPFYRDWAATFPRTRLLHRQIADRNIRDGSGRHEQFARRLDRMEFGSYSPLADRYGHAVLRIRRPTQAMADAGVRLQHDWTHLYSFLNTAVNQLFLSIVCQPGYMRGRQDET